MFGVLGISRPCYAWKSSADIGTMCGRRSGIRSPATPFSSSGSLKLGSIWKARQASSRRSSDLAVMVWFG